MNLSAKTQWIVAAIIGALGLVVTFWPSGNTAAATTETSEPEQAADDELTAADEIRRQVMSEMGRKGGQKSKRGKAKKQPEAEENEV